MRVKSVFCQKYHISLFMDFIILNIFFSDFFFFNTDYKIAKLEKILRTFEFF